MGCGSHGPWPWKQLRRSPAANNQPSVAAVAAPSISISKPGPCTAQCLLLPCLACAQRSPAAHPPLNAGAQADGRPPGLPHSLPERRDGETRFNLVECLQAHSSTTIQQQQPPEQGSHTAGLPCSAASPCRCSCHNADLDCSNAFSDHAAQLAVRHPAGHGQSSSRGMRL